MAKAKEKQKKQAAVEAKPAPEPRLRKFYMETVREKLMKEFEFSNPHQVPALTKIVLNVGLGEAHKNAKALDAILDELGVVSGQRPNG